MAKTRLKAEHTAVFASYNLKDAKEKIRYAGMLYDTILLARQRKLVTDNKTELKFKDWRARNMYGIEHADYKTKRQRD